MRALFEQALKIDPDDSEALVGDATTYWFEYMHGWGNSETDYDAKILDQVERAVAGATYRRDVPRAFRTSKIRHSKSDAVKSTRSGYGHLATAAGRGRT